MSQFCKGLGQSTQPNSSTSMKDVMVSARTTWRTENTRLKLVHQAPLEEETRRVGVSLISIQGGRVTFRGPGAEGVFSASETAVGRAADAGQMLRREALTVAVFRWWRANSAQKPGEDETDEDETLVWWDRQQQEMEPGPVDLDAELLSLVNFVGAHPTLFFRSIDGLNDFMGKVADPRTLLEYGDCLFGARFHLACACWKRAAGGQTAPLPAMFQRYATEWLLRLGHTAVGGEHQKRAFLRDFWRCALSDTCANGQRLSSRAPTTDAQPQQTEGQWAPPRDGVILFGWEVREYGPPTYNPTRCPACQQKFATELEGAIVTVLPCRHAYCINCLLIAHEKSSEGGRQDELSLACPDCRGAVSHSLARLCQCFYNGASLQAALWLFRLSAESMRQWKSVAVPDAAFRVSLFQAVRENLNPAIQNWIDLEFQRERGSNPSVTEYEQTVKQLNERREGAQKILQDIIVSDWFTSLRSGSLRLVEQSEGEESESALTLDFHGLEVREAQLRFEAFAFPALPVFHRIAFRDVTGEGLMRQGARVSLRGCADKVFRVSTGGQDRFRVETEEGDGRVVRVVWDDKKA
uniref:RING-type domain-containing protein n=1 Tax=Chromera velia CCMP2878 TaxID=1169474 RepID=A0A0G4HNC1_9ALVE|eukprot:Cvel_29411.t1-p1 / transcript=Cvel_29411.t1 / gene=Cvel_29411 / organism=Chromera_velia_CCMP2878 / gene_product=hypothetical protein / transcript_product=hypothetical protein / location=Cvel_scaffold4013:8558-10992(-) / protein_length=579 / sequence_SO=supercontig / SO=protein_coding / is_pseudo=false